MKHQGWESGDVFAIPLARGEHAAGQVLDLMMPHWVRCAFFADLTAIRSDPASMAHPIAALAVSHERLDRGAWRVVAHERILLPLSLWPNEATRARHWVGAKSYDAALVHDLLSAWHGHALWDDWADPAYLDRLLLPGVRRPTGVKLKHPGAPGRGS